MSQRLFVIALNPGGDSGEGERDAGPVNTMAAAFCVDCGLKLAGLFCLKCGQDYGANAAVRRASSPLATAVGSSGTKAQQDVSSSTAGAQRAVAKSQQDVSSSTAGAQRAVSPSTVSAQRTVSSSSRPARSLSAPAGTRGRGQGGFTFL
jgi:hypothetical protein